MIYSAGCGYGIRALVNLARAAEAGQSVLLRDILRDLDVPQHFVGKVFQSLVRADILGSTKGRGGGFALLRPPEKVHLREVVEAIDGPKQLQRAMRGPLEGWNNYTLAPGDRWNEVRRRLNAILDETTLADLVTSFERKMKKSGRRR